MTAEPGLPRFTRPLRPVVDAVARSGLSVHRKLLFGFLSGALLLVAMAVLSLAVIGRMSGRVAELDQLHAKVDSAQQMLYLVTAQSHYRAMALLTRDDSWNTKIAVAKQRFGDLLEGMARTDATDGATFDELRAANAKFADFSAEVLALYEQHDYAGAQALHISEEHRQSHVLEDDLLRPFIATAQQQMEQAQQSVEADRGLLTAIVVAFSAAAVIAAMLLGFVLSWGFILPVRTMERALAGIRAGDFSQRVQVANRDELGKLAAGLNDSTERLATLFDEQRKLTDELSRSNASLAQASEAKSRFLANVSHELRTPLNAILGFTDALIAGVDGPLNDEQKASLGWVRNGGRDLLGLINEVLDLSRIEAGKLAVEAEAFDPRELVEAVVAQHRSLAVQKGIRFGWRDVDAPAEVVLDRQRLRQVLVNLVGNALKYTDAGSVEVEAGGAADRMLRIEVRDTGPGIPADQHEAIFEEFRQVAGPGSGTGLGLAIGRRLARLMGGEIRLDSAPGAGSVFHLTLPLDCRSVASSGAPDAGTADAAPAGA